MIKKVKDLKAMVLNTLQREYEPALIENEPWHTILPFEISRMIIQLASQDAEYLPPVIMGSSKRETFVYGALRTVELYKSLEGIDAKFLKWYYGITAKKAIPKHVTTLADKLNRVLIATKGASLSIYQEVIKEIDPSEVHQLEEIVRQLYYTPLRLEFTSIARNITSGCNLPPSWSTRWNVLSREYHTLGTGAVLGFIKDLTTFCNEEAFRFKG